MRFHSLIPLVMSMSALSACSSSDNAGSSTQTMTEAPFGAWTSTLSAARISEGGASIGGLMVDGDDVYWVEARPAEQGRNVVMRLDAEAKPVDVTPAPFNVRTRVHEYGGGAWQVDDGEVFFSHFVDNRLYRQSPEGEPVALTSESNLRYADCTIDRARERLLCVREDHRKDGEPVNGLVAVGLKGGAEDQLLWQESDFVAAPRLSADGSKLAWVSWNHPNMPWDHTALWVADIGNDGALRNVRRINDGVDESAIEPQWSPDGQLYFVSDRSGWWNLRRWSSEDGVTAVLEREAEFAGPLWSLGQRSYRLLSADEAVVTFSREGFQRIGLLNLRNAEMREYDIPFTSQGAPDVVGRTAWFVGHSETAPSALVRLNLDSGEHETVYRSAQAPLAPEAISKAQPFQFSTAGGATAHAFFYPPHNPGFKAPEGERPPALVFIHGGPTGQAFPRFNPNVQFWTQRGIAVIDVNYRGSAGFGRDYRNLLREQWGVVDVEDAVYAARHAVEQGWADQDRLAIRGGSAGGYTTLAALAFHDVFAVGANHFGISDIEALARDTHKFESRYLDSLIGPYPQTRERYIERSPIHHLDGFDRPLIVFQGLDDKVVPPNQSEMIVEALKTRGVPVAYLAFEGEGHGFRRSENQIRSLEAELYFYGEVLGFKPADEIEPVEIIRAQD